MNVNELAKAPTAPAPTPKRMGLAAVSKGPVEQAPRVLLYGAEGIGKSTWASGAPSPIWLGEMGTQHLDVARFPAAETWSDALEAVATLTNEAHDYKTLVIDGLAEIEGLIFAHLCVKNNWSSIEHLDYGKGYQVALDEWRKLVVALERLHQKRNVGIILIGHSQVKAFRPPESEAYDRHTLVLNDKAAALLRRLVDYVLFAQIPVTVAKGADRRARGRMDDTRLLHTQPSAAFDAKSRPSLPSPLPLSYAAFATARRESDPAEVAARAKRVEALSKEIAGMLAAADADTKAKVTSYLGTLDADDEKKLQEVRDALKKKVTP